MRTRKKRSTDCVDCIESGYRSKFKEFESPSPHFYSSWVYWTVLDFTAKVPCANDSFTSRAMMSNKSNSTVGTYDSKQIFYSKCLARKYFKLEMKIKVTEYSIHKDAFRWHISTSVRSRMKHFCESAHHFRISRRSKWRSRLWYKYPTSYPMAIAVFAFSQSCPNSHLKVWH